jgi:hypothetical protein
MWNRTNTWIILGFLLLSVACKSRKQKLIEPVVVTPKIDTVGVSVITAESILKQTVAEWTYFSSKIDMNYKSGSDSKSFDAAIRMYKDSIIWMSVSLFGIEGARIIVNKDSVVILNKLERNYMVYKMADLKRITSVDLQIAQLQKLILARPLFNLKDYQLGEQTTQNLKINNLQSPYLTEHLYLSNVLTILQTMIKDQINSNLFIADYTNYSVINGYNFPLNTLLKAKNEKQELQVTMEFKDTEFNVPVNFPFNIPQSYAKIK